MMGSHQNDMIEVVDSQFPKGSQNASGRNNRFTLGEESLRTVLPGHLDKYFGRHRGGYKAMLDRLRKRTRLVPLITS